MAKVTIEEALEYCLVNPDGLSVEELLRRFPDYRMELEPLLALASQIETVTPPPVPADRRAAMKARLMDAAAAQGQATQPGPRPVSKDIVVEARKPNWIWAALRRPVYVAGSFAALLIALLWWGAAAALPNNPLYGVKLTAENLFLNFSGDTGNQAKAHLTLANSRLDDIETMDRQKNLAGIDGAVNNYNDHMNSSTTLWKQTTGQAQQSIKQSISATITRCVEDFKSFSGDVALLPGPVKAEVQKLYNDLSAIRVDIGESPNIEAPVGITVIIAPTATPEIETPVVAVLSTSTSIPGTPGTPGTPAVATVAATQGASIATSTAGGVETATTGTIGTTVVVNGTSIIGTPVVGQSPTQVQVETQVPTFVPTKSPSVGPSVGTPLRDATATQNAKVTATPVRTQAVSPIPVGTQAVSPTRPPTNTAVPSNTAVPVNTSTPVIIVSTPVLATRPAATSTVTQTATSTPPVIPTDTRPGVATSTAIPTIVVPPTIYIPPSNTVVIPTLVPPGPTTPPTVGVGETKTTEPKPPTPIIEATSEAECSLHANNVQVQSSCTTGGDVSWTVNVVNTSSSAQNSDWDATLLVMGQTGGYVEVQSKSGGGVIAANSNVQIGGTFSNIIPAGLKSLRVVVRLSSDGRTCGQPSAKDKNCRN